MARRKVLHTTHQVKVVGEVTPTCAFQNGVEAPVRFKVLEGLKRPLFSDPSMNTGGLDVIQTQTQSYAVDAKTGSKFKIYSRKGVSVMPVWIDSAFLQQGQVSA